MNDLSAAQTVLRLLKASIEELTVMGKPVTPDQIRDYYEPAKQAAKLALRGRFNSEDIDSLNKEKICKRVEMEVNVWQGEAVRLVGESTHAPWLANRRNEIDWNYWNSYKSFISGIHPPKVVKNLEILTDDILDLLNDPKTTGQWDSRGLVMGHVQSGKTLNYIGLIAKAVDAGYRIIIILTGLHDNLRVQTQIRTDEGFIGRDTKGGALRAPPIGVGMQPNHTSPIAFTTAESRGDFKKAVASGITMNIKGDQPKVFVIKKNKAILNHLRTWLNEAAEKPEGHERISDIPLLIIDDEADQASVDTKGGADPEDEDYDPSAINQAIRLILNDFDQSSYVGYTATPFANIFIADIEPHPQYGLDLFPKDFIWSLDAPSNYIGPETLFGFSSNYDGIEKPGLPLVRTITDSTEWLPDKHKKDQIPGPIIPDSLISAVDMFILACAAKLLREEEPHHNSMLIHVTRFVDVQEKIQTQINEHIYSLRTRLENDNGTSSVRKRLAQTWAEDFLPSSKKILALDYDHGAQIHTFEEIEQVLIKALSRIRVVQISGNSQDVLDYNFDNGVGNSVITVGGDKLSRGVTLEGLSTSYYGRPSRMYDTLMQMGRWFGYRQGYLDLCRIWTTSEISSWYRAIALAIHELVDEFKEMSLEGMTPKQFGLKVRSHPVMMITNRTKLKGGRRLTVTFSGSRPEVTSFEKKDREEDFHDIEQLLLSAKEHDTEPNRTDSGDFILKNIPSQVILEYLQKLKERNAYNNSKSIDPTSLSDYIEKRNKSNGLSEWTILLKSKGTPKQSRHLAGFKVGLHSRTNLNKPGNGDYAIKSLIGSADEAADLDDTELANAKKIANKRGRAKPTGLHFREARSPEKALLIIYPLEGDPEIGSDETPYTGISFSLPNDRVVGPNGEIGEKVEYVVNSIWQRYE
jgi:hypothetical protein